MSSTVDDSGRRVLRVHAAGRTFAVDAVLVRAVERLGRWARLPGSPSYVRGVAEVRGRVVAVVDLASRLGLDEPEAEARRGAPRREPAWRGDAPVVVVESAEPVALAVEALGAVSALGGSREAGEALAAAGVARVASDGAYVLDVEAVVDGRPLAPLRDAELGDRSEAGGGGKRGTSADAGRAAVDRAEAGA